MRRLIVFNQVSLDGCFVDMNNDMRWAYPSSQDDEWEAFVKANASGGGLLIFGRITYELMSSYWPTPAATRAAPIIAERMNNAQKIVFSRTLKSTSWNNTRILSTDVAEEIRKLKIESERDMAILGSGSLVTLLTQACLIDEYQIVIIPIILGKGRTMFDGLNDKRYVKLISTRTFRNGNVLLCYRPKDS